MSLEIGNCLCAQSWPMCVQSAFFWGRISVHKHCSQMELPWVQQWVLVFTVCFIILLNSSFILFTWHEGRFVWYMIALPFFMLFPYTTSRTALWYGLQTHLKWRNDRIFYTRKQMLLWFGLCLNSLPWKTCPGGSRAEVPCWSDLLTLIIIFCLENSEHCCYFFFLINPYDNSMALWYFFISILHKGDICNHADSNQ